MPFLFIIAEFLSIWKKKGDSTLDPSCHLVSGLKTFAHRVVISRLLLLLQLHGPVHILLALRLAVAWARLLIVLQKTGTRLHETVKCFLHIVGLIIDGTLLLLLLLATRRDFTRVPRGWDGHGSWPCSTATQSSAAGT